MRLERLSRDHDRGGFTCGRDELDDWLQRVARQAAERAETAHTYVLTDDGETILGFFSVAMHHVTVEQAPEELLSGQPPHLPVSALLLARLAVAKDHQGEGLGDGLMRSVVEHVLRLREYVPVRLLAVDAMDEEAARFYEKYGFKRWPADALKLFVKVKDLARTFGVE